MHFVVNHIYHIYNQGNNRQKIFFNKENYLFFLRKVKIQLLPFCDILAWCLMPNHFHFMVMVKEVESLDESQGFTQSETLTGDSHLNHAIGVLLRSYTRAINKQNGTTGSLFRQKTKAECLTCPDIKELSFCKSTGTKLNIDLKQYYLQTCFNYIHQNPIKAGLVKTATDWEYSSAQDYFGKRNGKLVNKELAMQYLEINSSDDLESSDE